MCAVVSVVSSRGVTELSPITPVAVAVTYLQPVVLLLCGVQHLQSVVLLLCAVQQSPALDLHGVTVVCGAAVSSP